MQLLILPLSQKLGALLTMLVSLNTRVRGRGLVLMIFFAAEAFCRSRSTPFADTRTKSALILRRPHVASCDVGHTRARTKPASLFSCLDTHIHVPRECVALRSQRKIVIIAWKNGCVAFTRRRAWQVHLVPGQPDGALSTGGLVQFSAVN